MEKKFFHDLDGKNFKGGGPICLYGKKGIGKTTRVIEWAHQLIPKYPDAQFYIDLQGEGEKACR